ncbi:MAG TPA: serine/threonine-protein kinase [Polyangia bacterium]|nr:serine/threonine-protein kinase [Polyangia bacterium]
MAVEASLGPPSAEPPARGSSIGRYVVLGLVGKGAMGEVYAAYDPELDRKVAVKLLRVRPGNGVSLSEGRTRTLREAQAIAKLSHPNVVVVFDAGTFHDEVFIAMEFVEGNTVSYWLQAEKRRWQEVLKVFLAAGRGLAAAHEKDLVHRDFKPDNVMVGSDGQVRVMDFGLARQVGERGSTTEKLNAVSIGETTRQTASRLMASRQTPSRLTVDATTTVPGGDLQSTLVLSGGNTSKSIPTVVEFGASTTSGAFDAVLTRTGAMMGTPAYMSPEQFLGTGADARSDQFSFCVALYEGLYGQRPFSGKTMMVLTANVVQGILDDPPPQSRVPLWLRKVLLRGLSANANHRFPSMADLLAQLERDPAKTRRNRLLVAGALVLPLLVGVGVHQSAQTKTAVCSAGPDRLAGVWELSTNGRQSETPSKGAIRKAFMATKKSYAADVFASVSRALDGYVIGWTKMYREACVATQIRGEQSAEVLDLRMSCLNERLGGIKALTSVFREATGAVVENAVSATNGLPDLARCADVGLLRALVKPPEDAATRAQVDDLRHRLSEIKALDGSGRWAEAMRKAPDVVEAARALKYQPVLAESLVVMGVLQHKSGDPRAAEHSLEEAYLIAESSRHDEVKAQAATEEVWAVGYLEGKYPQGEAWARYADSAIQRIGGHERLQAWLLNDLGAIYDLEGRQQEALLAYQRAIALKEKILPSEDPDIAKSLGNAALTLQGMDRNQEALESLDRAIAILEKALGSAHPDLATQLSNRGEILNALGRFTEARASFERAMAIWERELGSDHPYLGYALTGIGQSFLNQHEPREAVAPLERALRIREAKENVALRVTETRFALAQALWDAHRERHRATALATRAKTGFAAEHLPMKVAEIEAWLASHGSAEPTLTAAIPPAP